MVTMVTMVTYLDLLLLLAPAGVAAEGVIVAAPGVIPSSGALSEIARVT